MKKIYLSLLCVTMLLVLSTSTVHAIGIGFYSSVGSGSGDWEDDYLSIDSPKLSTDTEHRAFGISLDTNVAGRRFFNYHLNLGREKFTSKKFIARDYDNNPSSTVGQVELEGMVMAHTFAFGGQLSNNIRMWMGPEIRWHWVDGSASNAPAFALDGGGFGFGPSLGINFNFPSGLTLMLKAGYIMSKYYVDGAGYINGSYASNDYDIDEKFMYLNLEFLFRSQGDR